jgi:hypothetical protein
MKTRQDAFIGVSEGQFVEIYKKYMDFLPAEEAKRVMAIFGATDPAVLNNSAEVCFAFKTFLAGLKVLAPADSAKLIRHLVQGS